MKFKVDEFRSWKHKCITLLGMSGVGKTYLSEMLRRNDWFHYSGDYRIGTRYLNEHILDLVKAHAMRDPFLRDLLRHDWVAIHNNIKIKDLGPVLSFVGKLGNPERGGLPLGEFNRRQALYREAEIAAMMDVPDFVRKAQEIYSYPHLINDVGGSLCELDEPRVIDLLAKHSLILYIRVPEADEIKLIQRAQADPKPLYYRPDFLRAALKDYLSVHGLDFVAQVDPDDFTRWVFPRLFHSRVPRYEAIARPYGYTVSSEDVARVRDEQDFLQLIESAIGQAETPVFDPEMQ